MTSATRRARDRRDALLTQIDVASRDSLGFGLRPTQRRAGLMLLDRCIAEMPTGEGKTLTTSIPASILASEGRQVLIATANDYLAERDASWMQPIYHAIGLSVASISSATDDQTRRRAYDQHVVYGTLREFAFDFLRRSLSSRDTTERTLPHDLVQDAVTAPPPAFPFNALVLDEADSILIDEARTPMIITAAIGRIDHAREACYRWAAELAPRFVRGHHYIHLDDRGLVALTEAGRHLAVTSPVSTEMHPLTTTDLLHALERAIRVNETVQRDVHYVIQDDAIHLVDEYTGRKASERNFGGGVHQAVEAREGLNLTPESETIARISVQDFVSKFDHLCGMTATGWEDRREFQSVYGLTVRRLPPHVASQRRLLPPVLRRTQAEKWQSIADETEQMILRGRSVLVGTRTIEQSESLSQRFQERKIEHVVLNARNPASEAGIVAKAGQPGRVTVATNMAGRGTDIQLAPSVRTSGGLHVIVSEPHAALRIDRQLIGRCARQGDPGTARLYASADDEILAQAFGKREAQRLRDAASRASERWLWSKLRRAQRQVARQHRIERQQLTARDLQLADAMLQLGLDPHLDPLPETR